MTICLQWGICKCMCNIIYSILSAKTQADILASVCNHAILQHQLFMHEQKLGLGRAPRHEPLK